MLLIQSIYWKVENEKAHPLEAVPFQGMQNKGLISLMPGKASHYLLHDSYFY